MNPEQYLRAKAIFLAACERPASEHAEYLDVECRGDTEIRREVESLLAYRDDTLNTVQPADPQIVRLAGRYVLGSVIGRGGMGRVYEAVDERFGRKVAVKELSIEGELYANAFGHEARLLNGLRHPALPVVIDLFVENDKSYLIMDFVAGQNLRELTLQRLETGLGPWPPTTVLRWVDELLDALEYLGSFQPPIVHRDIKPHNLKLTPDNSIVLLDFGLAKGVASDATGSAHSVPGYSLHYAPLEQLRGSGTDVRADLFALGATVVHLLAGTPPPDALTRADAMVQGKTDPLGHILDALPISTALAASLRQTLSLNRSDRPQSAAALRAILRLVDHVETGGRSAAETKRGNAPTGAMPAGIAVADATNVLSSASPTNLPQPMTGFLGRDSETNHLIAMVRSARVVTLTGPGGIGKTRLALRIAEELVDAHPGGVWFVDLSSLPDPALVAQTVATSAGIDVSPECPVIEALDNAFSRSPTLVVLDNCEHVLDACATLADRLVRSSESLRVIATSRERLGIAGERVWPVGPLTIDAPGMSDGADGLESEAARLFVDRARRLRPSFEVTQDNSAAILELCRRLEGIPLAIELAAARVNVLSVEQILKLIDKRLSAYASGDRTAPERQRTLGAAIDWSFNLLDADERTLLGRLSLFPVAFGLEAVLAIAASGVDALMLLGRLVDKSLVNVDERRGEARYRLLETTRVYAADVLRASADAIPARDSFVAWARALITEIVRELSGPNRALSLERTDEEHDALLTALALSLENPSRCVDALEIVTSLAGYWHLRGYVREGRVWLERVAADCGDADVRLRAIALRIAAAFANVAGDVVRAETLSLEALAFARKTNDAELLGRTLTNLAITLRDQGRLEEATSAGTEGLAILRALDDDVLVSIALLNLGAIRLDAGSEDEAGVLLGECLELKRALGDRFGIANSLANLASVHKRRSEWAEARALLTESLSLRRGLGEKRGLALTLVELATVEIADGRPDEATALLAEGTAIYEDTGDRRGFVYALEAHAQLASARGEHARALTLAAAAAGERERLGTPLLPIERAPVDAVLVRSREAAGITVANASERDGRAMSRERVLEMLRGDRS